MNLLRNKKVLYLVLFFAICEVVLLASNKKYNTLVFFVVLGVLSSYFTKNMTIVLLIPLVVTYFLARGNVIKEGMDGKKKKVKKIEKEVEEVEEEVEEVEEEVEEVVEEGKKKKAKKNDLVLNNLSKQMDAGDTTEAMKAVENLVSQQEAMMNSLERMGPIMENAGGMIEKMGGLEKMGNIIDGLSNVVSGFGNISGGKK